MLRLAGWEVKELSSSASVSVVPTREWLLAVIKGIDEDNLGNAFFAISCSISLLYPATFFLQIIVLGFLSASVSVVPTREWLLAVIKGIDEDNLGNAFFAISCSISLLYPATFFLQIIVLGFLSASVSVVPTREWLLAVNNRINEDNLGYAFFANDCSTTPFFFANCRTCSSFCFCLGRANQGMRVINMINGINEIYAILDIRRFFLSKHLVWNNSF